MFKLDLFATSKGLLANLKKNNSSVTKKKKKLLTGTVGFDTGFTKLYLKFKYSLTTKIRKKLVLINSDPRSIIKKQKDLDILRRFILYPRKQRKYFAKP